jgi:hypothetical protein
MTNRQQEMYNNTKSYDMAIIEKMQYAVYVLSEALIDAIASAKEQKEVK